MSEGEPSRANVIEANTTIYVLQQRIDSLEKELEHFKSRSKSLSVQLEEQKTRYEDMLTHLTRQVKTLDEGKRRAEDEGTKFREQFLSIQSKSQREMEEVLEKKNKETRELKEDIAIKTTALETMNKFKAEKEQYVEEIASLKRDLEKEKTEHKHDVQNLQRQMFDATERLRKEMFNKIKEARAHLMALNDEQLSTTTRLTILQNHQLTTQLEFQSKQAEKLVETNSRLEERLSKARRELVLHTQVENEMAKKSHYYQKVIHKMNTKLKIYGQIDDGKSSPSPEKADDGKKDTEELILFLEGKLEEAEKKYAAFRNDYDVLQEDYKRVQDLFNKTKDKYGKAAILLSEFLDGLLTGQTGLLQEQKDIFLDVEKLKSVPLEQLEKEERAALVLVLLKQLQPYLNEINLDVSKFNGKASVHKLLDSVNIKQQIQFHEKMDEVPGEKSSILPPLPAQTRTIDESPSRSKLKKPSVGKLTDRKK